MQLNIHDLAKTVYECKLEYLLERKDYLENCRKYKECYGAAYVKSGATHFKATRMADIDYATVKAREAMDNSSIKLKEKQAKISLFSSLLRIELTIASEKETT